MRRRQFLKQGAVGSVITSGLVLQGCSTKKEYDLLIIGGTVYDGLGNPGIEADVAVKGDRIAAIMQNINPKKAVAVIEAKGMAVAPGFIDPHTHTDIDLIVNPKAESKIRQGVTTEIGGNCGYSQFPLNDRMFDKRKEDLNEEYGLDLTWHDIQGFFSRLEQGGIANNHATLLGNGALRNFVMGPYDKPPTSAELEQMKQVIREYMQAGAMGLSSGLAYTPSAFAKTDELIELCRELIPFGGVYVCRQNNLDRLSYKLRCTSDEYQLFFQTSLTCHLQN
jgi:N-acyl-D-amino-acid deacylase